MKDSYVKRLNDVLKEFDNVLTSSVDYDAANNQVNIVLKLESTQTLRPEQKDNMESITKAMFSVVAEVSVSIDTEKQVRYK